MLDNERESMSARRRDFESRNLPFLGRIHSSAQLLVPDPEGAADLVVRAYAAVYRNWGDNRGEVSLLKSLCRAMMDLYYDDLRAADRGAEVTTPADVETLRSRKDSSHPGRTRNLSGISLDEVRKALGNLPADIRPAAVMYYLARFSNSEVAEIVGRQQELTKSMISRSRKLLQDSLLGGAGGGACLGVQIN